METNSSNTTSLSSGESTQLVAQLVELTGGGLPLAEGLLAAAEETPHRRLRTAMRRLAERVRQGSTLDAALSDLGSLVPPHVAGVIRAGNRTGKTSAVLVELANLDDNLRRQWRRVISALTYPTILLILTTLVTLFVLRFVVPIYTGIFDSFMMDLPPATLLLVSISRLSLWIALGIVVTLLVVVLVRLGCGAANWRRVLTTLPGLGVVFVWWGAAEFSRLLGLLVEHDVPLPEAVRLTGQGVQDAAVRRACDTMAGRIDKGERLSAAIADHSPLPWSLVPLIQWGEENGCLPESLEAAAEMMEGFLRYRTYLLQTVLPPIVFLLIFVLVGFVVLSLLDPLFRLTTGLGGGLMQGIF